MLVMKYFIYLVIYSFLGWIFETALCTIKGKKWENRGFLFGPIVPIYGFGGLLITYLYETFSLSTFQIFVISFIGSMVLEYVTSYVMEKLFRALWWDYSDLPLNIQGRTCVLTSLGFGVAGLVIIYLLYPLTCSIVSIFSENQLAILGLFFMFMIGMDTTLTIAYITDFENEFLRIETEFNEQMTELVEQIENELVNRHQAYIAKISKNRQRALARIKSFKPRNKDFEKRVEKIHQEIKNIRSKKD